MDLFALGTPVMDLFARADTALLAKLGVKKGATNYFSAKKLSAIEHRLGRKISRRYAGDNARNVCEGFAALGGFCGFQGAVGDDSGGAYFEANLQECGVANFLQEREGSTGKIIALVSPGAERTFCADLGVSGKCGEFEGLAFSSSKMFFVASITLCLKEPVAHLAMKYLGACRKAGKKAAISLENPPMVQKNRKFLLSVAKKYADVLFMNGEEAAAFLGEGAERKLLSFKPKIPVYLKKGKRGSVLFLHGKAHTVPARKAKAIDTTGAGDSYAAGALYGLSRKYTPLGSARLGTLLASKVVQKIGAGIPLAHTRVRIRHKKN